MIKPSSTTPPVIERRSGSFSNLLAFLLMVVLVTVLLLFAAGFTFVDKVQSVVVLSFHNLRQLFSFQTSSIITEEESSSSSLLPTLFSSSTSQDIISKPSSSDLEAGLLDKMKESSLKEKEGDTSDVTPLPEVPVVRPKRRTLEMAIETLSNYSEIKNGEQNEPIPIEENDITHDVNGWCYIGQSKGARSCAPVGEMDKCVTGELYANQMECLQIEPDNVQPVSSPDNGVPLQPESESESDSESEEEE